MAIRLRGMSPATLAQAWRAGRRVVPQPKKVFLCIADHFEPDWNDADETTRLDRIDRWITSYPIMCEGVADCRGRPPQHTFFYPIETYQPHHVERLMPLVRAGYGDVEVHLHHDNDTDASLRKQLTGAVGKMHQNHGLFRKDASGRLRYGFVHGNWALDNSHPDGCWCGVNNELTVLMETGCYADFTMPAAPHAAQTRTINQIYYAVDNPQRPKSHDRGVRAQVGRTRPSDSLMMIQGPLVLTRKARAWKPTLENGNLMASQPPLTDRMDDWLRAGVCVKGQPDWLFVKLHTHGAQPDNADVLLNESMTRFHRSIHQYASRRGFDLYYVTARELALLVQQAERRFDVPDFDVPDFETLDGASK